VSAEERSGREIRLLVLVIAVAVAVLLVLARFRFPSVDLSATPPTPGPLERLAARATFDDLASTLADVTARVTPVFVVAAIEKIPEKLEPPAKPQKPPSKSTPPPEPAPPSQRWVPALRVRPELLLAYVPSGMHVIAVEGWSASPQVGAADDGREVVLIRVPAGSAPVVDFANAAADFVGSTFVVAIEGALGGPAARPVFVPRIDAMFESRWSTTLFVLGGEPELRAGTFAFTLDGRFIGLAVRAEPAGVALVPAAALERAVADMAARLSGSNQR
jgi:hypothetical protein